MQKSDSESFGIYDSSGTPDLEVQIPKDQDLV